MRIGIVGAGSMGTVHAAAWVAAGAEVVGVHSKSEAESARLAASCGARVFGGVDELINACEVLDICAPSFLHRELTLAAAAAGRHVVCEKPIALTLEDGEAMIAACEAAGVRLFVAMVVRFFPQYRAAREVLAAGRIGELGVARLQRVSYPPQRPEDNWFLDEARSGGMLVDLMIHDLDYARWVGGEVSRVYARSARTARPDLPADYALVTLRFASGAMALVEGGWAYPPGFFRTSLDLAGSRGVVEWSSDDPPPVRAFLAPTGPEAVAAVGLPTAALADDPYALEIAHVHEALAGNTPFSVTARDGLEALRLALAARQSLRTGRAVAL